MENHFHFAVCYSCVLFGEGDGALKKILTNRWVKVHNVELDEGVLVLALNAAKPVDGCGGVFPYVDRRFSHCADDAF